MKKFLLLNTREKPKQVLDLWSNIIFLQYSDLIVYQEYYDTIVLSGIC